MSETMPLIARFRLAGDAANPSIARIALAWTLPFLMLIIRLAIAPLVAPYVWFLYYPTIFVCALVAGVWGGLGGALISSVLVWYFFLPPEFSWSITPVQSVILGFFILMGYLVGDVHRRLALSQDELSRRVASSEARFGAIVEQSLVGIYVIGGNRFLYVNPEFAHIFGYADPEEFLASVENVLDVVAPGDRQRVADVAAKREAGEIGALRYSFRALRKDGSTIVLEVHGKPVMLDGVTTVVGAAVDQTERVAADLRLRERENLLARTSKMAKVGGWTFEVPSMEGEWTEEIARIHDVDPNDATNVEFGLSFYEGWSRDVIQTAVQQAIAAGRPYDVEIELVSAKGVRKWVRSVGIPVQEGGRVVRVQGTMQDVTERHLAEQAVRDLNVSLERRVTERTAEVTAANEELESFAYAVSHDLRAPLRAMSGFCQALEEDYGASLDERGHMYTSHIVTASKNMGDLIDGLLLLSRATRGDMEREWVDVSALARDVIAQRRLAMPDREVTVDIEPDLMVYGDPRMLGVVVQNLVGNAWKYSGKTPDAHISVFKRRMGVHEWICVHDNGAGFNEQYAAQLFEPFHRLHRQDDFPGIGIGLATVRRIMNRHGGLVEATATEGEGATFRFWVPGPETVRLLGD